MSSQQHQKQKSQRSRRGESQGERPVAAAVPSNYPKRTVQGDDRAGGEYNGGMIRTQKDRQKFAELDEQILQEQRLKEKLKQERKKTFQKFQRGDKDSENEDSQSDPEAGAYHEGLSDGDLDSDSNQSENDRRKKRTKQNFKNSERSINQLFGPVNKSVMSSVATGSQRPSSISAAGHLDKQRRKKQRNKQRNKKKKREAMAQQNSSQQQNQQVSVGRPQAYLSTATIPKQTNKSNKKTTSGIDFLGPQRAERTSVRPDKKDQFDSMDDDDSSFSDVGEEEKKHFKITTKKDKGKKEEGASRFEKELGQVNGRETRLGDSSQLLNVNRNSFQQQNDSTWTDKIQRNDSQNPKKSNRAKVKINVGVKNVSNEPEVNKSSKKEFYGQNIYQYEIFFNDNLAEVSDRVKDLMFEYKEIKKNLQKEQEEMKQLQGDEKIQGQNKTIFDTLAEPIKNRKAKKEKIKEDLDEYKRNYPTQKKQIPKQQREKDFEANILFLEDVVETMKGLKDPIRLAYIKHESMLKSFKIQIEDEEGQPDVEWREDRMDPQVFLDAERRRKERLEMLGRKLQKFVAERNISFNLKMVFKRWRLSTEEWRENNTKHISVIGKLRQFLKNAFGSEASKGGQATSSGQAAQSSEGKTTDENQDATVLVKEADMREVRNNNRKADRFNNGEDNDEDIVEPDQYTKNKLIPNCFGVYKAN